MQTSWFYINDNVSMRANIPSRMEYREFVRQESRESKFKKNLREKLAKKLTGQFEKELD